MHLSIPTNWGDGVIELASSMNIESLIGVGAGPIGHTCVQEDYRPVSKTVMADHIHKAALRGIPFNLVVDAPCSGNREYDLFAKEEILDYFKWASELGITTVTVAGAFGVELIKHHLPHLKVIISKSAFVDSIEKIKQFAAFGADGVVLHPDCNRNIDLLRLCCQTRDCDVYLVVNHGCGFQCVMGQFHALELGHSTAAGADSRSCVHCEHDPFDDEALIKMRWIRPEDIRFYTALGMRRFLIEGQGRTTAWIDIATRIWRSGGFDGNMLPLLDGGVRIQNSDRIFQTGKLDHFLDVFETVNCRLGCHSCRRCKEMTVSNQS